MRGDGTFVFACAPDGHNLAAIIAHIQLARARALAAVREDRR
jgi:urease accessory protein